MTLKFSDRVPEVTNEMINVLLITSHSKLLLQVSASSDQLMYLCVNINLEILVERYSAVVT